VQLEKQVSWFPAISPDGAWLAYLFFDEEKNRVKISLVPMAGRKPTRVVNAPAAMGSLELLRWTADGRALSMVETRDGVDNIWNHPLSGEPPKQLTNFSSGQIFGFEWSLDGKQLAVARGSLSSDVVLINNFHWRVDPASDLKS
jgi:Tol biopolymer transport system component